jgi:virulence-associated protein VagC
VYTVDFMVSEKRNVAATKTFFCKAFLHNMHDTVYTIIVMQVVKLSKRNYSQMLVIPKEYRLSGDEVKITPYGRGVLIEPIESDNPLVAMLDKLIDMPADYMSNSQERHKNIKLAKREELFKDEE